MAAARFRIRMTRNQIPFQAPEKTRNPFEGRITQEELDEGVFVMSIDQMAGLYTDSQIETLLEEMRTLSADYENECIDQKMSGAYYESIL
ncbi:MAG: hypothetical protein IBX50_04980 [Marinospirillum sp.]|uniref:hypothetical protein n=1 Tax=Marinospirillum sp. TaxID=2183934 RepID=UPI0019F81EDB|nr:hypothetical protein [Marinospirillum sp.]MBE0506061.1 hypothetical protein [Marinospirillum sp.]